MKNPFKNIETDFERDGIRDGISTPDVRPTSTIKNQP